MKTSTSFCVPDCGFVTTKDLRECPRCSRVLDNSAFAKAEKAEEKKKSKESEA